jgi:hypothetical protein
MKPYTVIFYIDADYGVHTFVEHVTAADSSDAWDKAVAQAKAEQGGSFGGIRSYEFDSCTEITTFDGHLAASNPYRTDVDRAEEACSLLRRARDLLKEADCKRTVERVRLALSSAKGAVRNVGYRAFRAAEATAGELLLTELAPEGSR